MKTDSVRPPPLSLYVHLPWCERKCPYCDFNSFERNADVSESRYVSALLADLDRELDLVDPAERGGIASIYMGGGTPSLFSGSAIARLIDGIQSRTSLASPCEISIEANPGSSEQSRFRDYRTAGVTRISIGVQSFRDPLLRRLGRVHSGDDAKRAVKAAAGAGFENINLDLMYGLPGDDSDGSLKDLATALSFQTPHLSWYQLTLEPGTAFFRKPPRLQPDDSVTDTETRGRALIARSNLDRYEVSGYARQANRCAHNLNYWQFGDYIGIGAGAHGKITTDRGRIIERMEKHRNPITYMDAALAATATATARRATIGRDDVAMEFMMNVLRLIDGVDLTLLQRRTGIKPCTIQNALSTARQRGWLDQNTQRIMATASGRNVLNQIITLF